MNAPMLIFLAVVVGVMALYFVFFDLFLNSRERIRARLKDKAIQEWEATRPPSSPLFKDTRSFLAKIAEGDELEVPRRPLREVLEEFILQSGMEVTLPGLIKSSAFIGAAVGLVVYLFMPSPYVIVPMVLAVASIPWFRVKMAQSKRQAKLLQQLPDAFDLISRVLRSGQSMGMAIKAVAEEFEEPLSTEAAYCYEQQNLGLSPEAAFRSFANRTGILEIRLFVTALSVQQKTGGNLAELIDKLSNLIRDRFRLRGQINTLTAEGRFQAILLVSLPFLMFVVLTIMNPDYELELLKHPKLIMGTIGMMIVGGLWIRKIVSYEG